MHERLCGVRNPEDVELFISYFLFFPSNFLQKYSRPSLEFSRVHAPPCGWRYCCTGSLLLLLSWPWPSCR